MGLRLSSKLQIEFVQFVANCNSFFQMNTMYCKSSIYEYLSYVFPLQIIQVLRQIEALKKKIFYLITHCVFSYTSKTRMALCEYIYIGFTMIIKKNIWHAHFWPILDSSLFGTFQYKVRPMFLNSLFEICVLLTLPNGEPPPPSVDQQQRIGIQITNLKGILYKIFFFSLRLGIFWGQT